MDWKALDSGWCRNGEIEKLSDEIKKPEFVMNFYRFTSKNNGWERMNDPVGLPLSVPVIIKLFPGRFVEDHIGHTFKKLNFCQRY
jgi:hypothetical protein